MQRLIGLLLLIFVPLVTMAQTDYLIHDDFRAGVATTHSQTQGTMHGFDMAQRSEITQRQISERCKWLGEW